MTDATPGAKERSQITYSYEGPSMAENVATLEEKKSKFREMGGAERVLILLRHRPDGHRRN